jgi:hypothetical protein
MEERASAGWVGDVNAVACVSGSLVRRVRLNLTEEFDGEGSGDEMR